MDLGFSGALEPTDRGMEEVSSVASAWSGGTGPLEDDFIDARLTDSEKDNQLKVSTQGNQEEDQVDEEEEEEEEEEAETSGVLDQMGGFLARTFSNTYTMVKRAAISEETEEILEDIFEIANMMLDPDYNSAQILAACRVLSGFESNRPRYSGVPMTDLSVLKHAFYWWQFAEAAFGWALVHGIKFGGGFAAFARGATTTNNEILLQYCKLQPQDILYAVWDARPVHPGNYIVVDHRTKSIVWAVRGTFGLSDVLTDLVASSAPFLKAEYLAHKGMARSVETLVSHGWPIIRNALKTHPGYGVVTTGHSMGASCASMVAMWIRHHHPQVSVVCWAFACPPCVSFNLAESTKDYIFCVSFGDDVITRLSLESINMLKRRLRLILAEGPGFWTSLTQGVAISAQVEEKLRNEGHIVGDKWKFETEVDPVAHANRLWPPYRHLYIYEAGLEVKAEESDCTFFDSVVMSNNMLHHHMPMELDKMLIRMIKDLRLKEKAKKAPLEIDLPEDFETTTEIAQLSMDSNESL